MKSCRASKRGARFRSLHSPGSSGRSPRATVAGSRAPVRYVDHIDSSLFADLRLFDNRLRFQLLGGWISMVVIHSPKPTWHPSENAQPRDAQAPTTRLPFSATLISMRFRPRGLTVFAKSRIWSGDVRKIRRWHGRQAPHSEPRTCSCDRDRTSTTDDCPQTWDCRIRLNNHRTSQIFTACSTIFSMAEDRAAVETNRESLRQTVFGKNRPVDDVLFRRCTVGHRMGQHKGSVLGEG